MHVSSNSTSSSAAVAKAFPENLPKGWRQRLEGEKAKEYFKKLTSFLQKEAKEKKTVFPPKPFILRALQSVDYDEVKVVILGQDPYHGPGQAIGLSFAVPNELKPKPPSLMNIFKEIAAEFKVDMSGKSSDLSGWTAQGVLLLNTILTVRAHEAFSHRAAGWEHFTDEIIRTLNERKDPVIFILWGAAAQKKKELISKQHYILESAHPSPLSASRGFFGCNHFLKANAILKKLNKKPIDWTDTGAGPR